MTMTYNAITQEFRKEFAANGIWDLNKAGDTPVHAVTPDGTIMDVIDVKLDGNGHLYIDVAQNQFVAD